MKSVHPYEAAKMLVAAGRSLGRGPFAQVVGNEGFWMAGGQPKRLSDKQVNAAKGVLSRHDAWLQAAGVTIDWNLTSVQAPKINPIITIDGDTATVDFRFPPYSFSKDLVLAFKEAVPMARYNGDKVKTWRVPLTGKDTILALYQFAQDHMFEGLLEVLRERAEAIPDDVYRAILRDPRTVALYTPKRRDDLYIALAAFLKETQGAHFNNHERSWDITLTLHSIERLRVVFGDVRYRWSVAADVEEAMLDQAIEQTERVELSRALEAELPADFAAKLGGEPFPFQRAGILFAADVQRAFIADEPGLGKTVEALGAIELAKAIPALIVVPSSLVLNWAKEARKWLPNRLISVMHGARKRPYKVYVNGTEKLVSANDHNADVVIVSYDQVKKFAGILGRRKWRAAVLDEAHYIKSAKTQRTKAVMELIVKGNVPMRLLVTGTPILNHPWELITQLQLLGRINDFGGVTRFSEQWCRATLETDRRTGKVYKVYGKAHEDRLVELHQRMRPFMIRRAKKDVLKELPPKQRSAMPLEIDNRAEYEQAERDLVAWVKEQVTKDKQFMASIAHMDYADQQNAIYERKQSAAMRAMRAEAFLRISALRRLAVRGKIGAVVDWLKDFLEGSDEKMVIYAVHREAQAAFMEAFPDAAHMTGEDSNQEKEVQKARFQNDPACRVIVCSTSAAAEGHTLTAASHMLNTEMPWTPGKRNQVEDRIHRIGQEQPCMIWYPLAVDTIDEWMVSLVEAKEAVVNAVSDGMRASDSEEGSMLDNIMMEMAKW